MVEKFVMQLEAQLADRNVTIELVLGARKDGWPRRATTRCIGARPLARVIQEHIKKPLAEELLFGKLAKGGSVKVTIKDDKLAFEIIEGSARTKSRGNGGMRKQKGVPRGASFFAPRPHPPARRGIIRP